MSDDEMLLRAGRRREWGRDMKLAVLGLLGVVALGAGAVIWPVAPPERPGAAHGPAAVTTTQPR